MWFRRLTIDNLRNIEVARLELSPGLNFFHGENGAGKTAVLEAVHLLARGRSFRTPHSAELIRQGADRVGVSAVIEDEHRGEQRVGLAKSRGGRTEVRINGESGRRLSQVALLLPLQVMAPSLSDLVFGAPSERRQWLDWGTFHVEHGYLDALRSYLHALRQRNAALKAVGQGSLAADTLSVWTDEVVAHAGRVTDARRAYLREIEPLLLEAVEQLNPAMKIDLLFKQGWQESADLRKVLGDSLGREVKSGITQSGPHRADIEFRSSGMLAGAALSRGQGKALASAMMLSQARLLMRTERRASVFLIDDIGAELDQPHSERFFRLLSGLGSQILATANSAPERSAEGLGLTPGATFHVEHGRVTQRD
ncbi:MAG TPA: DNA replication/repair protein RecF [Spirochaetia bacterium]|nr:DNA replication/repair protein RecF [Spirochaetia bacterium]